MNSTCGFHFRVIAAVSLAVIVIAVTIDGAMAKTAVEPRPIKVGFITSLTGAGASDGPAMLKGVQLYLEQIGYRMDGHPVELCVEDDHSNIATAITKAKKLIVKDNVDVLTGVIFSPFAYAIAPIADSRHTPFLISTSTADDLTQRKRCKWVLRICSTSSQISMPLGEYAARKLRYKKVVTIGCDYAHCYEVVGGFHKCFEESGGEVIQKLWLPMDEKDFSPVLAKIDPAADAVFMALVCTPARLVPQQLHAVRPKLPIIASTATLEDNILEDVGPYVRGAISTNNHTETLLNPMNRHFSSAYRSKYKEEPSVYARGAYNAGLWINKAVEDLSGDIADRDKFLTALKEASLKDSINGPIRLDSDGAVVENVYVRQVQMINGQYRNVVIDTYPNVSQFWKTDRDEFLRQPVFSKDYPACANCLPRK